MAPDSEPQQAHALVAIRLRIVVPRDYPPGMADYGLSDYTSEDETAPQPDVIADINALVTPAVAKTLMAAVAKEVMTARSAIEMVRSTGARMQ